MSVEAGKSQVSAGVWHSGPISPHSLVTKDQFVLLETSEAFTTYGIAKVALQIRAPKELELGDRLRVAHIVINVTTALLHPDLFKRKCSDLQQWDTIYAKDLSENNIDFSLHLQMKPGVTLPSWLAKGPSNRALRARLETPKPGANKSLVISLDRLDPLAYVVKSASSVGGDGSFGLTDTDGFWTGDLFTDEFDSYSAEWFTTPRILAKGKPGYRGADHLLGVKHSHFDRIGSELIGRFYPELSQAKIEREGMANSLVMLKRSPFALSVDDLPDSIRKILLGLEAGPDSSPVDSVKKRRGVHREVPLPMVEAPQSPPPVVKELEPATSPGAGSKRRIGVAMVPVAVAGKGAESDDKVCEREGFRYFVPYPTRQRQNRYLTPAVEEALTRYSLAHIKVKAEDQDDYTSILSKLKLINLDGLKEGDPLNKFLRCLKDYDKMMKSRIRLPNFLHVGRIEEMGGNLGVFARKDIDTDVLLGCYSGELIRRVDVAKKDDSGKFDYVYNLDDTYCVDASEVGNYIRYLNHASTDNANVAMALYSYTDESGQQRLVIGCYSIRLISKGEQLQYNYGPKYDWSRVPGGKPKDGPSNMYMLDTTTGEISTALARVRKPHTMFDG